jgi:hypothetical protein
MIGFEEIEKQDNAAFGDTVLRGSDFNSTRQGVTIPSLRIISFHWTYHVLTKS